MRIPRILRTAATAPLYDVAFVLSKLNVYFDLGEVRTIAISVSMYGCLQLVSLPVSPLAYLNKNSSGDQIANVNFFYNIAHVEASAYAH